MKKISLLILIGFALASCKKSHDTPPVDKNVLTITNLSGRWKVQDFTQDVIDDGVVTNTVYLSPVHNEHIIFKEDLTGTFDYGNWLGQPINYGLSGNNLTISYHEPPALATGGITYAGTWKIDSFSANRFVMTLMLPVDAHTTYRTTIPYVRD